MKRPSDTPELEDEDRDDWIPSFMRRKPIVLEPLPPSKSKPEPDRRPKRSVMRCRS